MARDDEEKSNTKRCFVSMPLASLGLKNVRGRRIRAAVVEGGDRSIYLYLFSTFQGQRANLLERPFYLRWLTLLIKEYNLSIKGNW